MIYRKHLISIALVLCSQMCVAQKNQFSVTAIDFENFNPDNIGVSYIKISDSVFMARGICKNNSIIIVHHMPVEKKYVTTKPPAGIPLFAMHGNVMYDFSYRSFVDTPFAQAGFAQHLVQTNLNFLIKDKYPVAATITNRSSNSPYFKNYTDVNIQFNQRQLLNHIKADLTSKAGTMVDQKLLASVKTDLDAKTFQLSQLQAWVSNPVRARKWFRKKNSN